MIQATQLPLAAAGLCAAFSASAATITVQVNDGAGKPLADVVVWLDGNGPQAAAAAPKTIEIEQRGLKFLPLVSVIQTGSKIAFPNYDKVRHHIYSFSPAKKFDQKLYSGVAAATQQFDKAGTVVLGCNIHDRMIAYIKVVDAPVFAKTDASGSARLSLPGAGKYSVSAWHYQMSGPDSVQSVVAGDGDKTVGFKIALKPPAAEPDAAY